MAKALKCDRCGVFYDYIKCLRKYQIHDMDVKSLNNTIDLCPDCYEIFTKWLTGYLHYIYDGDTSEKEQEVGTGELYPGEFESRGDSE